MLLKDARDEFLFDCECKHLAKGTIRNYKAETRFLVEFLELKQVTEVEEVKAHHIRDFMKQKQDAGSSACYVNDILKVCKTWFHYLVDEDYIEERRNPAAKVKNVRQPKTIIETFSVQEMKSLIHFYSGSDYLDVRNKTIITLLFDTGMRCNEMIQMVEEDIKRDYIVVKHGKGNKERVVPKSPTLSKQLLKYLYTITLYFLRNISSIAARYGKLQKEIQLGNEYLFEREHDVDRFRKVHIKDKLPDFFDNAFGLIEPTWFKAKADYQFYYSLVGAKTPDKGKTTFAKEVSQRLKVRVHYYETVSKNYNLYSYLTKNVDRKYYNKDRKELIDTFGLRKDGHLLKSMGMFNQYLEENQIEYRLKSNKKNNKVYWTIVKTDENERNPLYRVTNDLKGEI